ncbi:Neu5Ac-binding protein [uncultured Clostridium sp.]|jgi:TRAP-type transport system periplasmic protein|nr:Neu5Ac-binding protein [uncultured Clostridium sp.]
MRKMMKRMAAVTMGMAIAMTATACSSNSGSAAPASTQKEGTDAAQSKEEKEEKGTEAAGESYTLMFGHAQTETHPYQACFQEWADAVAKKTNGGLVIDLYPSNTLGSEEDIINSFKDSDTNWGYNTDFARLGTYVPELAMFNLPYFVETMDDINAVKELDMVKEWIQELEAENDIKVVSLNLVQGYRNVVAGKAVTKPEDLKGLTLRCPNTEIWRAAVSSLGCSVQGMGRGDIYNNLVNKVIDGYEDVYPCIVSESYYEIKNVNTISETHNILLLNPVVVDAGWFNSLPEEYQTILMETCDEASSACSEKMLGEFTEEAKQRCIDEGMTVIDHSEIDVDAFREAAKTSYEQLGLTDTYNQVMEALGR